MRRSDRPRRVTVRHGDRGAVSAELVAAVPALLVLLALCLGGLTAATAQARAHEAATIAARLVARGAAEAEARRHVAAALDGARLGVSRADGLLCATVDHTHRVVGIGVPISARSCTLDAGW